MSTINLSVTVTDSSGASATATDTASTDTVQITSITVTPDPAAPGTMRTLTVVATSSAGLPLSAMIAPVSGITFTPVAGTPPGTFAWTFVY